MIVLLKRKVFEKFWLDKIYDVFGLCACVCVCFLTLTTVQELGRSESGTESLFYSQPVSLWQDWDQLWLGSKWEKKPGNFFLRECLETGVGH